MPYDNEAKGYIERKFVVRILKLFAFVKKEIVPEGFSIDLEARAFLNPRKLISQTSALSRLDNGTIFLIFLKMKTQNLDPILR